ncbi:Trypomastigote, Alanine, Serine and Valine rich protein (TASV), subfamily A [Trypanosoma cruzi]|uniref:Trypomastigote, Alanine, Serine and Valine rich protein (TASV), subfamily A n=1 Tax=Trypanosoma cruzi TaxID=5693 RepID=A0A2V2ULU9_TRYCR|nr:Trypomastigote, Alanine, Serine and Valine rich protein (TASV), subfamily A [Trypanosoma cruzi]
MPVLRAAAVSLRGPGEGEMGATERLHCGLPLPCVCVGAAWVPRHGWLGSAFGVGLVVRVLARTRCAGCWCVAIMRGGENELEETVVGVVSSCPWWVSACVVCASCEDAVSCSASSVCWAAASLLSLCRLYPLNSLLLLTLSFLFCCLRLMRRTLSSSTTILDVGTCAAPCGVLLAGPCLLVQRQLHVRPRGCCFGRGIYRFAANKTMTDGELSCLGTAVRWSWAPSSEKDWRRVDRAAGEYESVTDDCARLCDDAGEFYQQDSTGGSPPGGAGKSCSLTLHFATYGNNQNCLSAPEENRPQLGAGVAQPGQGQQHGRPRRHRKQRVMMT